MNKETVNNWLCKHSPISSSDLRMKVGITVKGTPIATRLGDLVSNKCASVTKQHVSETGKDVNLYSITEKGKKWNKSIINSSKLRDKVESVEVINSREYASPTPVSSKNAVQKRPMSSKAKGAMGALAQLLSADDESRKLLKGTAIKLRAHADTIDEFLSDCAE